VTLEATAGALLVVLLLLLSATVSSCHRHEIRRPGATDLYSEMLAQLELRNYAQARSRIAALIEDDPRSPLRYELRVLLAGCHENLGDYETAAAVYRQVLEDGPPAGEEARIVRYLALTELRLEDFEAAASRYRRALDLEKDPDERPEIAYRLGVALQRAGDFDQADRVFAELASENATETGEWRRLARRRRALPRCFTVQVGAYGERRHAEDQCADLERRGFPAWVEDGAGSGAPHLVYVGCHAERADARRLRERLLTSGALPAGAAPQLQP
jgi:tetratricopeptide (TPR) repeat protein